MPEFVAAFLSMCIITVLTINNKNPNNPKQTTSLLFCLVRSFYLFNELSLFLKNLIAQCAALLELCTDPTETCQGDVFLTQRCQAWQVFTPKLFFPFTFKNLFFKAQTC